jgi:peptidyl-prolyl cis-trans isomerase A (cyclophilin A)
MFRSRIPALLLLTTCIAATGVPGQAGAAKAPVGVHVIIETELGNVEAVIDTVHAPVSGKNFLRYVDAGLYKGSRFHRTVTRKNQDTTMAMIEVIQGSLDPLKNREGFPAIPLERTSVTGLKHLNGTLSMARSGPDTGTSQYFVCIGPQPELDFGGKRNADGQGFAAFGQVIKGMEIVRKIQMQPADGQNLTPPVKVIDIVRKK